MSTRHDHDGTGPGLGTRPGARRRNWLFVAAAVVVALMFCALIFDAAETEDSTTNGPAPAAVAYLPGAIVPMPIPMASASAAAAMQAGASDAPRGKRGGRHLADDGASGDASTLWSAGSDRLVRFEKLLDRGHKRFDAGRTKAATKLYRKATRLVPEDARGWWAMGLAFHERGRSKRALRYVGRSLALSPSDPMGNLVLALIAHDAGMSTTARDAYATYLSVAPEGAHAPAVRAVLDKLGARPDASVLRATAAGLTSRKPGALRGTASTPVSALVSAGPPIVASSMR